MENKIDKELLNNPAVEEIAKKFARVCLVEKLTTPMMDDIYSTWVKEQGVEQQVEETEWEIVTKQRLKEGTTFIHTIRIKATGEEISVGDNTTVPGNDEPCKISSFEIDEWGRLKVWRSNELWSNVTELRKYTPPTPVLLLITEDKVGITDEMETVYGVRLTNWQVGTKQVKYINESVEYDKWFSTAEARQEYIVQNKPMFSYRELQILIDGRLEAPALQRTWDGEKLKYNIMDKAREKIKGGN